MDVILVQPKRRLSHDASSRTRLPLGLLAVATPLDIAGYKVKIIDMSLEVDWKENLLNVLRTKPICVGVTSMTGPQLSWGLKASEIVKQNSDVPVVWGGVHASLLPRQTLGNPFIDIVVQGEGEETFLELVKALANGEPLHKIKGIWYKEDGQIKENPPRPFIDLNQQPPLAYHLVDVRAHFSKISGRDSMRFETSRGCPYRCAFCYNTAFARKHWRALTPEETLARLERIVGDFGIKTITFIDDNFFVDENRAHSILEGLIIRRLDVGWGKGDIRLDMLARLDNDFLNLIERSGCLSLCVGIESGSQRIANILRKEIDVSQAIPVNRRLAKYKMQVKYLFLFGTPGETEADIKKSVDLILRLVNENPKAEIGIQLLVPYPGTELFDLAVQHGLAIPQKLEDWFRSSWANRRLDYPWLTADRRRMLQMVSFCGYFLANGNPPILSEVHPLVSLAAKIYRPVAENRLRRLRYRFLPELKIAELLGFRGY